MEERLAELKRQRDVLLFSLKELLSECNICWDGSIAPCTMEEVGRASQVVAEIEALINREV
jgi:hypothetical protein